MIWDDIVAFVGSDAADNQSKRRRRQSTLSTAFWVLLVIAMVTVFWLVFNA